MMMKESVTEMPIDNFLGAFGLPENFDPNENIIDRNKIVSFLLNNKETIQKTFANDEYLALDATNHRILGVKSNESSFLGYSLDDKETFKVLKISKYRDNKVYELANSGSLYNHIQEH
jgi:hypothetical protein